MDVFRFTKEDLEEILDQAKATVLIDLVQEGIVAFDTAEEYAMQNTIVLKKKNFFRTLTDKWKKAPESNYYMIVVGSGNISSTVEHPPPGGKKGILSSMLDKVLRELPPTTSGLPTDGTPDSDDGHDGA